VIKDWENWKPVPVDSFVLSMYQLQIYYFQEIQRGIAGKGLYHLKSRYKVWWDDYEDGVATSCPHPDQIVHCILIGHQQQSGNGNSDNNLEAKSERQDIQDSPPFSLMSLYSQATEISRNDDIVFNTKMRRFIVKGHDKQTSVQVFLEQCTHPTMKGYYHILAAKMCLNMVGKEQPKINFPKLRKKCTKGDKKKIWKKETQSK